MKSQNHSVAQDLRRIGGKRRVRLRRAPRGVPRGFLRTASPICRVVVLVACHCVSPYLIVRDHLRFSVTYLSPSPGFHQLFPGGKQAPTVPLSLPPPRCFLARP